ncbi:MAG: peptide chain release factor-like protein [Gemmatimonadota bacterium]|nr:peptide chain release factor-like protein [Gemmatimonadota bacterium]
MPLYNTDPETLLKEVQFHPFRGGGPGGQNRNKVESAVRLVHLPSGITVVASEHRFQGRNRDLALQRLRRKLIGLNHTVRPRIPTKPSRASREKRMEQKRRQARKKALRRIVDGSCP